MDVGLAGAEVAALDRVVEETVDAVAVVLVVLGGVDAALRGAPHFNARCRGEPWPESTYPPTRAIVIINAALILRQRARGRPTGGLEDARNPMRQMKSQ